MEKKICRACEYTGEIHKAAVEKELRRLSGMKGVRLCPDDIYRARLTVCGECRHLDMNSVCMMCGCYVQIRAFIADGRCPMKLWEK